MSTSSPRRAMVSEATLAELIALVQRNDIAPLRAKIEALETSVAALRARPQLQYRGIWRHADSYPAGSLVTHASALWFAEQTTEKKPGSGADDGWRLILKADRDRKR